MAQRIRSYAAAGAAVAVAGAVAVAPAPAQSVPERALAVASPAFQLTTTANPIEAWIETFQNSYTNFLALTGEYFEAPFPVVQQVLVNWAGYVELLPDVIKIAEDIVLNAEALIANQIAAQPDNLTGLHGTIYGVVKGQVPEGLVPLLDYSTNYNSGMVIGALGLLVSPLLALETQIDEFVTEFGDGDLIKAANALINIPAAMTDGFFNGHGILSLDFLIPLLPPIVTIDELGIAMGGLLSPAGSIFNSVNAVVDLGFPIGKVTVEGVKAGLIGSWFAANQSSAEAIGWSGEGNPLAALGKTGAEEEAEEEFAETGTESPESVVDDAEHMSPDPVDADSDESGDVLDVGGAEPDDQQVQGTVLVAYPEADSDESGDVLDVGDPETGELHAGELGEAESDESGDVLDVGVAEPDEVEAGEVDVEVAAGNGPMEQA